MRASIPPENKYCLTIPEAAAYFNIGEKRLVSLLESPEGYSLVLMVGVKRLVKKRQMEEFLDKAGAIYPRHTGRCEG